MKIKGKNLALKKESGDMADVFAAGLVIIAATFLVLVFIGFSKSVQMRMHLDNVAKKYLYQMESIGYMTAENESNMIEDFKDYGATVQINDATTMQRVKYGDTVTLDIIVMFEHPIYQAINKDNPILRKYIKPAVMYHILLEATSKW